FLPQQEIAQHFRIEKGIEDVSLIAEGVPAVWFAEIFAPRARQPHAAKISVKAALRLGVLTAQQLTIDHEPLREGPSVRMSVVEAPGGQIKLVLRFEVAERAIDERMVRRKNATRIQHRADQ